jgi:hypothetical protein
MRIGIFIVLVSGCTAPELAPSGIEFVRDGVIVDGGIGVGGELLNDGRELLKRDWRIGETLEIVGKNGRAVGSAPESPQCAVLWQVDLGTSSTVELSFSQDGSALKITTDAETSRTLDAWRGVPVKHESEQWNSVVAGLPRVCVGSTPLVRAIIAEDQYRYAAFEGPLSDGAGDRYRVTMYR